MFLGADMDFSDSVLTRIRLEFFHPIRGTDLRGGPRDTLVRERVSAD